MNRPTSPSVSFGLSEALQCASVPFQAQSTKEQKLQDTISKETSNYPKTNKSSQSTTLKPTNRINPSTHGKHSSYQDHHLHHHQHIKISTEYSVRFPTLSNVYAENNSSHKSTFINNLALQSPTGNTNPLFDLTEKFTFSSQQKKRMIRVQSKNQFPSDFFQGNQEDDPTSLLTFNDHPSKVSQQLDDFPIYYSNSHLSNNRPYTSSNPLKFSLPIPSPQVHFDTYEVSQPINKEIMKVTETQAGIIDSTISTLNSPKNNRNSPITNVLPSQAKLLSHQLPLNFFPFNMLTKQPGLNQKFAGQIISKNLLSSKKNNLGLQIQIPDSEETTDIKEKMITRPCISSQQHSRILSPKGIISQRMPIISPNNSNSSNLKHEQFPFKSSNKLVHSDPLQTHKNNSNLEQPQNQPLETDPITAISEEILQQLCPSAAVKRAHTNNSLLSEHPQSSHILQRPKHNQTNKDNSNNPSFDQTNNPSIPSTKRILNYEIKQTPANLHNKINKNSFSVQSISKRERPSFVFPESKETGTESFQKQATQTNILTSTDQNTLNETNNNCNQQQNKQQSEQNLNKSVKTKGTASNIDFTSFKMPTSQIGSVMKAPGSNEATNNFKSFTIDTQKPNLRQQLTNPEQQTQNKQKLRPQSVKVSQEMKKQFLFDLIENGINQQDKVDDDSFFTGLTTNTHDTIQASKQELQSQADILISLPSSVPPLRQFLSHETKTTYASNQQPDQMLNMSNSFENKDNNDQIIENYNKTARFTSMQDIGALITTPVTNKLKSLKQQPKIAVNLKECEKYKPFLIRKVSSQCSARAKQQSVPSTGSPNSSSSLQTFTFDFNKNFSGSTNPGGHSQVSSPTLLLSNEQFNSHEFSFSHQ